MIDDLFSHKIHASRNFEGFIRKLIKLAAVFDRFHEQPFDKKSFNDALRILLGQGARDDPFRDEYSIYMSVFGIGFIVWEEGRWICRLSETARKYLLGFEPNVEAFCRLQLALYQRPDARGQVYQSSGLRLEPGSSAKHLELIRQSYRVCPFRLILRLIQAKAELRGESEDETQVSPEEIYAIINWKPVRTIPSPPIHVLKKGLSLFSSGKLVPPQINRKSFKFLEVTNLIDCDAQDNIKLRALPLEIQRETRNRQITAIRDLSTFYDEFNSCSNKEEIINAIRRGSWIRYFDACRALPSEAVEVITGQDFVGTISRGIETSFDKVLPTAQAEPPRPKASEVGSTPIRTGVIPRPSRNPEETRIIRERRNSYHDLILQLLSKRIKQRGLRALQTPYIDLFTNVEDTKKSFGDQYCIEGSYLEGKNLPYFPREQKEKVSFVFEVKSSDDQIVLDQVRKAVSQLYEYRYRYKEADLNAHVILIIALQSDLSQIPWLIDYLLEDRQIGVCWLKGKNELACPQDCFPILHPFVDEAA